MERLVRKLYFGLLSRLHPELDRVEDEDERLRVSMVAGLAPTPRWARYIQFAVFIVVLPLIVGFVALAIASPTKIASRYGAFVFLGGTMAGYVVPAMISYLVRLRQIRRLHVQTMINVGYDTCPMCGYDLTGHAQVCDEKRVCPECAASLHDAPPAIDNQGTSQSAEP